jgi:hypothetical protein
MRTTAFCFVMALGLAALGAADDKDKKGAATADPAMSMPMPKPGPEHAMLAKDVGTWDAKVESWMEPGKPPTVSAGTEVTTMGPGGLWTITTFKSTMMGQPFEGHGTNGYDPAKKVFVGTWIDSMSTYPMIGESTWNEATKSAVGWMEGPGPDGKPMKMKTVVKNEGDDKRVFEMSMPGPDGKDMTTMRITYTRKK